MESITQSIYLTLKREWYDLILSGAKTTEYREDKPYWRKRLMTQEGEFIKFEQGIFFRNGYNPKSPLMKVKHVESKFMICPLNGYILYGKRVIGIVIKNPQEIIKR